MFCFQSNTKPEGVYWVQGEVTSDVRTVYLVQCNNYICSY